MSSPRLCPDISSARNTRQLTSSPNDPLFSHPFKRLAAEIRLQIWSEALPPPRILEFEYCIRVQKTYWGSGELAPALCSS